MLKWFKMFEAFREAFLDVNVTRASHQRNWYLKKRENVVYSGIIFRVTKFITFDNWSLLLKFKKKCFVICLLFEISKYNKRFRLVFHVLYFINSANLISCIAFSKRSFKLYVILYFSYYDRYSIMKNLNSIRYRIHRNRNLTTNK